MLLCYLEENCLKVIFLDIDGVLNTTKDRNISDEKLKLLSDLASRTGAEVVLSSSWRNWWNHPKTNVPESFITNWKQQFYRNKLFVTKTTEPEIPKGISIERYIKNNQIENFVVLDDENITDKNLVLIDNNYGVTEEDCSKAALFLQL